VADQNQAQTPPQAPEESPAKKTGRKFIIFGVVLLLVLGAAFWYWRSTFSEDTDDAQVDGDIYQISARISGQVTGVYVTENQKVEQGALLV
jgi:membrane fusion protein, multidrug efflux system